MESLLVECAVRAALLAVVVGVVLRAIGIKTAAARHTAWTSVMLTMLVLPVWTAWGPKASLRVLPAVELRQSPAMPVQNAVPSSSVRMTEVRSVGTSVAPPTREDRTWQSVLLIVYGFGVIALLARLAIGTARMHRLRSRANVQDGQGISPECSCPITVGWLHPAVILPKHWQEWSPLQLDAVLRHERAHVRRRDPLVQWLALVNRAVFWFHPVAWWLERKLSALAEEACDAAVLAQGHAPEDYSAYLLDIARSVSRSGSRLGLVGMAMPGSLLGQRIRRILSSGGPLPVSRTRVAFAVAACATSSALLASGTLEHARALVQPRIKGLVTSSITQQPAAPERVAAPRAAHERDTPRVLLAQAATPTALPKPTPPALDAVGKERQLQDAFLSNNPITDMPIAVEINYFQVNKAEYFVPVTVKIPGREVSLARSGGAERTSFDFLGQTKDGFGTTVVNLRDTVSINLTGAPANDPGAPLEYDSPFTLLPGRYTFKLLVRNNETGRTGTYETAFTVPNLNKEEQRIPISSVVLSNQRVDVGNPGRNAGDPRIEDGRRLIPSVTRVFSRRSEMYVYLHAYQHEAGEGQPLDVFATFYQGQVKTLETAPVEVTRTLDKSRAVPLSLNVSLADLKPGEYTCQITVRNPLTQKTALWEAPIVIEP